MKSVICKQNKNPETNNHLNIRSFIHSSPFYIDTRFSDGYPNMNGCVFISHSCLALQKFHFLFN